MWELSKAVYGLKQSSNSFWKAMKDHLVANGFTSMLGDPCLFRKEMPDGGVILAVLYVDDCTFAVSNMEHHPYFMSMLRSRFVVPEGEGASVEWLRGMAIDQDVEKGTVRMNMETAITKLALGLLTKEELVKAADVRLPMLPNAKLPKLLIREVPVEDFDYLSVVGSLMHLANCVRCDIAYAVGCRGSTLGWVRKGNFAQWFSGPTQRSFPNSLCCRRSHARSSPDFRLRQRASELLASLDARAASSALPWGLTRCVRTCWRTPV